MPRPDIGEIRAIAEGLRENLDGGPKDEKKEQEPFATEPFAPLKGVTLGEAVAMRRRLKATLDPHVRPTATGPKSEELEI